MESEAHQQGRAGVLQLASGAAWFLSEQGSQACLISQRDKGVRFGAAREEGKKVL